MKKSQVKSLASAGLFLATLYYGASGVRWCENVFTFSTFLYLAAVTLLNSDKGGRKVVAETYRRGLHLPQWVDVLVFIIIITTCAAVGWFACATAHVILAVLDLNARKEAGK